MRRHCRRAPGTGAQKHRIGNVLDQEFVEADHAGAPGEIARKPGQRIAFFAQLPQRLMHFFLHEGMEVAPEFLLDRQFAVKKIHQPGFAAADRTVQINARGRLPAPGKPPSDESAFQAGERFQRFGLRRIGFDPLACKEVAVGCFDVRGRGGAHVGAGHAEATV